MDAVDVLIEARAWVDKGWCQGGWARTDSGALTEAWKDSATQWCAAGAILKADGWSPAKWSPGDPLPISDSHSAARALFAEANNTWQHSRNDGIADFNDTWGRTKDEVLEAFDKAITLGLEREATS